MKTTKLFCLTVLLVFGVICSNNDLLLEAQYQTYGNYDGYATTSVENDIKIVTLLNGQVDPSKEVSAIIVTFVAGNSYDQLFSHHQQKSAEGTQSLVYAASSLHIPKILSALQYPGREINDRGLLGMIDQIHKLEENCPACIVFNWECSSGYSEYQVAEGKENLNAFLKELLDRGYMTMFSDFSLKALIGAWNQEKLGPNPFKQLDTTNDRIDLRFKSQQLIKSPSTQLQIVGKLAQSGKLEVNVLGGTIVYGVDNQRKPTDLYDLQVLTIAADHRADSRYISQIDGVKGTAGHVLLTYKSGGIILTSMGHWIQLLKIDTSDTTFFKVARQTFGDAYADDLQRQYGGASPSEQQSLLQKISGELIYQNSPGSNYQKGK